MSPTKPVDMADALQQELNKLEGLTGLGGSKWPSLQESLQSLLDILRASREEVTTGASPAHTISTLSQALDSKKKAIDERQKEIYNCVGKIGKSLDRKFPNALPTLDKAPFILPESKEALERVVMAHFLRTGQFDTAMTFYQETGHNGHHELNNPLSRLYEILGHLKDGEMQPAILWAEQNRLSLMRRNSSLEFDLHQLRYIKMLKANPPNSLEAIAYLRTLHSTLQIAHAGEIRRLLTALLYLPLPKLLKSPYSDLLNESLYRRVHIDFTKEYSASIGLSRTLPLRTVGDIGAGGALLRIEKGRKVMREKKSEWSQIDELPIEIPLPAERRYHSIFACPVSKEQSTEANPPMMMTCGHVLAQDSLTNMAKPGGRLKCPYCPAETNVNLSLRVSF